LDLLNQVKISMARRGCGGESYGKRGVGPRESEKRRAELRKSKYGGATQRGKKRRFPLFRKKKARGEWDLEGERKVALAGNTTMGGWVILVVEKEPMEKQKRGGSFTGLNRSSEASTKKSERKSGHGGLARKEGGRKRRSKGCRGEDPPRRSSRVTGNDEKSKKSKKSTGPGKEAKG